MADLDHESYHHQFQSSYSSRLLIKLMSKRRTWTFLYIFVYSIILSSFWNLLKSILSWYESTVSDSTSSTGRPSLYASIGLGVVFDLLSMAAALAVVVPATLVKWISVLVLLTFLRAQTRRLFIGAIMKLQESELKFIIFRSTPENMSLLLKELYFII